VAGPFILAETASIGQSCPGRGLKLTFLEGTSQILGNQATPFTRREYRNPRIYQSRHQTVGRDPRRGTITRDLGISERNSAL
jgi:hypothetical protein